MVSPIIHAEEALRAFDEVPDLRRLRAASTLLASVNLLLPGDPAANLSLRSRTLAMWLGLLARLDEFSSALGASAPGDLRSPADLNRLRWQSEAIDAEVSDLAWQFIQRYYTPSPVDHDELMQALVAANLSESRLRSLQN